MAGCTGSRRHTGMVVASRHPGNAAVTLITRLRSCHMPCRFASGHTAVVAGLAGARLYAQMIETRAEKRHGVGMAHFTGAVGHDMFG